MDIATVLGLILGFTMMAGALLFMGMSGEGSVHLAGFIDPPAIMMVLGGGLAVALVGFPLKRVLGLLKTIKLLFFRKAEDTAALIQQLVGLAEVARRDGLLALENKTKDIKNPFIAMGIRMAVDGIKPETVEEVMRTEIRSMTARHHEAKKVLETIGRCGPAFGMIATLLGLVMMLGNLSNAESIGPSMAVALVGTLYGAVTANLICIPMAEKLACLDHEEAMMKEIVVRGVMSIQSGDSPRIVEQKLITFLPPAARPHAEEVA
jgi:chemotaxis protein MotA